MNAVWNSYGQLCGCPEIFKKSCKFFCRELDIRVIKILKTVIDQKETKIYFEDTASFDVNSDVAAHYYERYLDFKNREQEINP